MTEVCNHGFWLTHCALCQKNLGECDYGSCTEPGTALVDYAPDGRLTEMRHACAEHAVRMEWQTRYAARRVICAAPDLTAD